MSSLTGKRRYRNGGLLRNKLILQVQVASRNVWSPYGDYEDVIAWRDATTEDLMTIQACHAPHLVKEI